MVRVVHMDRMQCSRTNTVKPGAVSVHTLLSSLSTRGTHCWPHPPVWIVTGRQLWTSLLGEADDPRALLEANEVRACYRAVVARCHVPATCRGAVCAVHLHHAWADRTGGSAERKAGRCVTMRRSLRMTEPQEWKLHRHARV